MPNMTDYSASEPATQQENSTEIPNSVFTDIAETLAFANFKSFFECRFQTDEGLNISIEQLHEGNLSSYPARYLIKILDCEDDGVFFSILETTMTSSELFTLLRLQDQYSDIDAKRRQVDAEITRLNAEEDDLHSHVVACTKALLYGSGE